VTVHGTGGTPETFDRIATPHEFRRQVQIQIEALPSSGSWQTPLSVMQSARTKP
jgi:hypothetical protein